MGSSRSTFYTIKEKVTNRGMPSVLEVEIKRKLRVWRYATTLSGIATVLSVLAVVPFLSGQRLHIYWDSAGRYMVRLPVLFFLAFAYAAGTAYNLRTYLRDIQAINKEVPDSQS